jgi:hypothetical protein
MVRQHGARRQKLFVSLAAKQDTYDVIVGDSQWLGRGSVNGHYVDLTARTAPTFTPRMGDALSARIDQDRMHLFDAATTEALF